MTTNQDDGWTGYYQELLHNAPIGIFTSTPEGRYTMVNAALAKMYGYSSPEEMMSEVTDISRQIYINPSDREKFVQDLEKHGEVKNHECCLRRADQSVFCVSRSVRAVKNSEDKTLFYQGFVVDITDQYQAKQDFKLLFNEMLNGFALHEIICDDQGRPEDYRFLAVNPAFEKMTGLKRADILGRTVLEVLPALEKSWIERYGKVALTGEPDCFENYSGEHGKYFRVTAFSPDKGRFACIFEDITTGRLARQEAREAHERLLKVLDNISLVTQVIDMQTHEILFMNQEAKRQFGDVVGRQCWKVLQVGQSAPCSFCTNDRLLDNNGMPAGIYRWEFFNEKTGRWYDCHDVAIKWVDGRLVRLENALDITDKKLAENELREQKLLLEGILENIPDIMSVKRTDLSVVKYNRAGKEFLNIQDLDVIKGEKCYKIIGRDSSCSSCATLEAVRTGKLTAIEKYVDELGKYFNCRANPIIDENGRIEYVVELIRDITDRKEVEKRIIKMNKDLEIANSEKDKLFSIIAHDLRSPISGIFSSSRIIASDTGSLSPDEIRQIANEMGKSTENLLALLNDLLQWSRMSQGSMDYDPGPCDIQDLIIASLKTVKDVARHKHVEIKYDLPAGVKVMVDEPMVNSIIRNLLFNAVKFSRRGSCVFIRAIENGAMITVSVEDKGIGMDEDIKARVFEHDKKKRQLGTEGEKSTGLGMILCKEFLDKHGGSIWLESEPGKGTTVYFTLPVADSVIFSG
ncbi:sensor histidine kinase [Desulfonatronovibrio magnus]|uniref:sensor histidine kinase n=1 Tax=Desulfonatronovibrio magnus TaxID=698827 RepID=UPI0005EBC223|nr:PAS domain-containing sensor histidine kinase [Desulfonatronovibrio magnus]